jgi:hypothetical protein
MAAILTTILNPPPTSFFKLFIEISKTQGPVIAADTVDNLLYQYLKSVYDALEALDTASES